MLEWLFHSPVVWMALVIFAGTYLLAAAVYWGTTRLGFKGKVVEPAMLSPLGIVFGLLVVFTASQVWGDLDRAGSAVASEASALRTVVLLADDLPKDEAANLRALISRHIEKAVSEEWPAMEKGRATLAKPAAELSEALQKTPTFPTTDDAQKIVQREIVSASTAPSKRADSVSSSANRVLIRSNGRRLAHGPLRFNRDCPLSSGQSSELRHRTLALRDGHGGVAADDRCS